MAERNLSRSCSNLSSSGHCWLLCSAWTSPFPWLPWHCLLIMIFSFNLHSNFSVTHLLKLAGLHAFLSYPPITCVRIKAYLVPQGQSYVQVLGEEGPEDSDGSFFSCYYFCCCHSASCGKPVRCGALNNNNKNAEQVEKVGLPREKRSWKF